MISFDGLLHTSRVGIKDLLSWMHIAKFLMLQLVFRRAPILDLCFSLFTSDLCTKTCAIKKYTDDTTILLPINKKTADADIELLRAEIINRFEWAQVNKLKVNLTKCKVIFSERICLSLLCYLLCLKALKWQTV